MAARKFFALMMFETARLQDEHIDTARARAKARVSLDPLLSLTETEFRRRYRCSKQCFKFLCQELKQLSNLKSTKRVAMEVKVLTALYFFGSGSYQDSVSDEKNISQVACSLYIEQVIRALTHGNILKKYIRIPDGSIARQAVTQRFYAKYGIPGVIGCVDCIHFKIATPHKTERDRYYSSKYKFYSLNVQLACDDKYRIINVNADYGGAHKDEFIWENSVLNSKIQTLHKNGEKLWLLGDSDYPQLPWLMTPIPDVSPGTPEANYNEKHMHTTQVIEETLMRLKNRWRCLDQKKVLYYKPLKFARIILACCVLHNIVINFSLNNAHVCDADINGYADTINTEEEICDLMKGRMYRDQIVRRLQ